MRCRRLLVLLLALAAGAALPCAGREPSVREPDYSIDRIRVQGCGDSLRVSVSWTFRDWNIDDRRAMVFQMTLKGGGHTLNLRPVCAYGRKAARNVAFLRASGRRDEVSVRDISRPVTVVVTDYFPYDKGLDTLNLFLTVSTWKRNSSPMQLSYGLRGSYVKPPEPEFAGFEARVYVPDEGPEWRSYSLDAPVRFDGSSVKFDSSVNGGTEEMVLRLRSLTGYRQLSFRDASLTLYCSYSGDGEDYGKLSRSRCQNFYTYLSRQGAVSRFKLARNGGGFDWDGVREWIARSRYSDDVRLLEIASWTESDRDKLAALRKEKPRAWEDIQRHCFPSVGRVVFRTDYKAFSFASPSAVLEVYRDMPELLAPRDFWYLSTLYDRGTAEWMDVTLAGAELYPDCWQLSCNAVQGLLDRDAAREASPFLRNIGGTPEGRYVTAVWCYAVGRYDECVGILEDLRDEGGAYADAFDRVVPFVDWVTNYVEWKKVNL